MLKETNEEMMGFVAELERVSQAATAEAEDLRARVHVERRRSTSACADAPPGSPFSPGVTVKASMPMRASKAKAESAASRAERVEAESAEGVEATPRAVHGAWHGGGGRVGRVGTQGASTAAHPYPPRNRRRTAPATATARRRVIGTMAPAPDESAKSESPEPMQCWLEGAREASVFLFRDFQRLQSH